MIVELIVVFLFVVPFVWVRKVAGNHVSFLSTSQNLSSWSISLSAVATNHSAFVYLGQIGFIYTYGLEGLWLTVGWKLGDWFSMLSLQHKLKQLIGSKKLLSITELLKVLLFKPSRSLQCFCGGLTLFALLIYSSAQLTALYKVLDFYEVKQQWIFLVVIFIIIFYYLFRGGFKASVQTDKYQSLIIFLSITVLFFLGLIEFYAKGNSIAELGMSEKTALIADHFDLGEWGALILFLLGWFIAGMGTISQPHMLTRFMAADNQQILRGVQYQYIVVSSLFSIPIIGVALLARELLPIEHVVDPELTLFILSSTYFPDIVVLLLVYGVISAAMSTLDSLAVAASAIIVRDMAPIFNVKDFSPRLATIMVMIGTFIYWFFSMSDVFGTVFSAWSLIVAVNLPMILLLLLGIRPHKFEMFASTGMAIIVLFLWGKFKIAVHELIPVLIIFTLVFMLGYYLRKLSPALSNS